MRDRGGRGERDFRILVVSLAAQGNWKSIGQIQICFPIWLHGETEPVNLWSNKAGEQKSISRRKGPDEWEGEIKRPESSRLVGSLANHVLGRNEWPDYNTGPIGALSQARAESLPD